MYWGGGWGNPINLDLSILIYILTKQLDTEKV